MFHGNTRYPAPQGKAGKKGFNDEIERRKVDSLLGVRTVLVDYELTPEFVEYAFEDEFRGSITASTPIPGPGEFFTATEEPAHHPDPYGRG